MFRPTGRLEHNWFGFRTFIIIKDSSRVKFPRVFTSFLFLHYEIKPLFILEIKFLRDQHQKVFLLKSFISSNRIKAIKDVAVYWIELIGFGIVVGLQEVEAASFAHKLVLQLARTCKVFFLLEFNLCSKITLARGKKKHSFQRETRRETFTPYFGHSFHWHDS